MYTSAWLLRTTDRRCEEGLVVDAPLPAVDVKEPRVNDVPSHRFEGASGCDTKEGVSETNEGRCAITLASMQSAGRR